MSSYTLRICDDCRQSTSGHCGKHPAMYAAGWPGLPAGPVTTTKATFVTPEHLCPDLLRYSQIGAADGWRGRVVRGFFWLLRAWPARG